MAACHNADSTGYETLGSMDMTATREKTVQRFDISSSDGMTGQHSAVDKNLHLAVQHLQPMRGLMEQVAVPCKGRFQVSREHDQGALGQRLKVNPRRKKCTLRSVRPKISHQEASVKRCGLKVLAKPI